MSVIVKCGGGKSSGLYVWAKYNADIGLGESINNIALANDGTSIDIYVKENLYIKEDGTIGVQGEPYSTVSISSVVEDTCIGGMTPTKYCIGVDGNVYSSPLSHIASSVDNCVANLVKIVKGNFIEYVVSDNSNKYPSDGEYGNYYYVATEDVTPEVTAQTPVITQIAVNLGVTITTPSGTNKQILQGNNANLNLIKGYSPQNVTIDGVRYKEDLKLVSTYTDLEVSTLPYDFEGGCAVVLGGEIHILGGIDNLKKHYKWDGNSWTSVSTLPYNFINGCAVVLNGEIHILGGDNASSTYKKHYKWNGSKWTSVSTLPYNFYFGSAVVLNGEIHILGTSNGDTGHFKFDGTAWSVVSNLPYSYSGGLAVVFNNEIHIMGGRSGSTEHYKFNGSSWVSVSTLPYTPNDASAVVLGSEIHMLGGGISFGSTSHYKFDGSAWTSVRKLPYAFSNGKSVVLNNEINILGNNTKGTNHHAINVRVYREVA